MVFLAIGPGTGTQVMGLKCFIIDCLESFKSLHCKIGVSVLEVLTRVVMSCYNFRYPPPLNLVA